MTDADDQEQSGEAYDPFEHVPERISPLTASGLAWLDEQLIEDNKATLRSLSIEQQASVLARLVESGAIGIRPEIVSDVLDRLGEDTAREREGERADQEGSR